jgi:hypothetical protein
MPSRSRPDALRLTPYAIVALLVTALVPACAPDPEKERLKATTKATYDKETGRLRELTYDRNKNGVIDTWTKMDGTKIISSDIDTDENGKIDRWEFYGEGAQLEKVALSRKNDGVADMWLYPAPDGKIARAEVSSAQAGKVDRWEWYESDALVRAEEDTTSDGKVDKWETYDHGRVVTAAFDENGDGRPDRRLTYAAGGGLVSIESDPDANGNYRKKKTM